MTTRVWNASYADFNDPNAWAPGGVPEQNDNLVIEQGIATITGTRDYVGETTYLGSTDSNMPVVIVDHGGINAMMSWSNIPGTDETATSETRHSLIYATGGYDIVRLNQGAATGAGFRTAIGITGDTQISLTQDLSTNANVYIYGDGALTRSSATLSNTYEVIDTDVITADTWNLTGNDTLTFLKSVQGSENINVYGNSRLVFAHADEVQWSGAYNAVFTTLYNFSGEIDLDGINAVSASWAKAVLGITDASGKSIPFDLNLGTGSENFDVWKTAQGAAVTAGTTPVGAISLLYTHTATGT